jgi:hypothetical protein
VQCLMSRAKDITIKEKPEGKGAYQFTFFLDKQR